ncbi:MAG: type IX secretion system membrane protein PorP/SprF [Bacteroidota bacterium]|nr:type IX secretion system membrane protein PorP/SprF [Bacteroidota bacterium]
MEKKIFFNLLISSTHNIYNYRLIYSKFGCKLLFIITLFTTSSSETSAQDPELSQFYGNPIYTNPAYAGTGGGCGRIIMCYRNQWPGLARTFETQTISWDRDYTNLGGGVGLMVTNDVAGAGRLRRVTANAMYSYSTKINFNTFLRFGMQASYYQQSIDWSKLTFSDMIDPRRGFDTKKPTQEISPSPTKTFPNFSTGALLFSENYYVGMAVHNLIVPNESFYNSTGPGTNLPRRYTIHGGMNISIGPKQQNFSISPNMLFMVQKQFTQINFGFYLNKSNFITGLWYRQTRPNSDALMVLVGFKTPTFKIGYSYDLTVSNARAAATGSHELTFGINIGCGSQKPNPQTGCPGMTF